MEQKVNGFNLGVGYICGLAMLYFLQEGALWFGIMVLLLSILNITIAFK